MTGRNPKLSAAIPSTLESDDVVTVQLSPSPEFHLTVDFNFPLENHEFGLQSVLDNVGKFQKLAELDGIVPYSNCFY
jgi:hypothetical protein